MLKKPKAKGSKYETIILLRLREIDPKAFRTMGSGNSKNDLGDIQFRNYIIEAKHYRTISFGQLFGKNGWWSKICVEGILTNKIPLLVYRQNNQPDMLITKSTLGDFPVFYLFSDWLKIERNFGGKTI